VIQYPTPPHVIIQRQPWLHATHPAVIDVVSCSLLYTQLLHTVQWGSEYEEGDPNNTLYYPTCDIYTTLNQQFGAFTQEDWIQYLDTVLGANIDSTVHTRLMLDRRTTGGYLEPHTDDNHFERFSEELGVEVSHSITQHIYIMRDYRSVNSGMLLHTVDEQPQNQIACAPGSYCAYVNTPYSIHSVPANPHSDDRLLLTFRSFW